TRFRQGLNADKLDAYLNPHSVFNLAESVDFVVLEQAVNQIAENGFSSLSDLQKAFSYVRDLRFLSDNVNNLMRRSTWLYPDDGCFARSAMMVGQLASQVQLAKIFVFGEL